MGVQGWGTEADSTARRAVKRSLFLVRRRSPEISDTQRSGPRGCGGGGGGLRAEKTPTSLLSGAKGNGMCQPETPARGQAPLGRSRLLPRALTGEPECTHTPAPAS